MSSAAISAVPHFRFSFSRPAHRTEQAGQPPRHVDAWKAIASAVDGAAAALLPMSVLGAPGPGVGLRARNSLIRGHLLLRRVQERNANYVGQARTPWGRLLRRRKTADLRPYLTAFIEAIAYAHMVADGQPASADLPVLLQASGRLPLIQRFRQDRLVVHGIR
ncbi:hypothetical protein [Streptomyces sp. NBC_01304]|uniref:hypothetical protein n=1 Tax=Streptomyces sp. NBC_01304 TaxID=2903818 RepID=UPI002E10C1EA|nr:hypothetical protein OG430_47805 [Streptomyces sp. NBC_01304]